MDQPHATATATPAPAPRSPTTLYHRVYLLLLQMISDRSIPPDQPIQGELDLAQTLGVSRITLRAALKRLEDEGLVRRERGRGTFPVQARLAALAAMPGLRNQVSLALKTEVRVLDHAIGPAGAVPAALLQLPPGADVLRIVRVRFDATSPISHSVCHVPGDLAPLLPPDRIRALPISAALASAGLSLDRHSEQISACLADGEVARWLCVDIGAPLLSMARTVATRDGRVVEHLRVLYRPDRYEYSVEYTGPEPHGPARAWRAGIADLAD